MTQATGQFLGEVLPPVLPMIAAPGQLLQAARNAAPITQATAQRGSAAVQQAARTTGQAIARPVQAATTAVRETLGMETPARAPVASAVQQSVQVADIPVLQSKTATLFDDWLQKSREQSPETKDVFTAINRRAQADPDVDFELRMVRTSDVTPTQVGDDYLNASSTFTAKQIAKSKSIQDVGRVEDVLPIRLDENMRIIDGNHRHAAAVLNKDEYIPALVPIGKGTGKVINLESIKQGAPIVVPTAPTPSVGARVSAGSAATPEALQRVTTAQGLRVPVTLTRGAAERDAAQLAFEKEQIKGEFGAPLRNRAEENNLQILQNFDAAIDATGAEAAFAGPSATGSAVVNALTSGYAAAKNKVRVAYKAAENAGELEVPVTHIPLAQFINDSTPEATVAPILSVAKDKGIQLGLLIDNGDGTVSAAPSSLKNSELLRRSISNATGIDPTNQLFGGKLKALLDADTEGMGGDLYKQARALRTEQARKFENRAVVARLIKNRKGMDDPQVAIDQVFQKSIMGGSPEEITFLKRVLLTSGKDGQQAWKELKAATMQHIRDQATSGVGTDSSGRPLVSPAKLNQVVSQLDKNGRLDVMFGKQEAQLLRDLNEVVKYVTTVPPGTLINSSGTAGTLMAAMAEAGATGAITGLPLPIVTGIKQIIKMRKEGRTKARINEALNALPPVQP
jgi:hypothetical protein